MSHKFPKNFLLTFVLGLILLLISACASETPQATSATADPSVTQGEKLFGRHCVACHSLDPNKVVVGPPLAGIGQVAGQRVEDMDAEEYLHHSIVAPKEYLVEGYDNLMPATFEQLLTDQEVDELVAFLLTLK